MERRWRGGGEEGAERELEGMEERDTIKRIWVQIGGVYNINEVKRFAMECPLASVLVGLCVVHTYQVM